MKNPSAPPMMRRFSVRLLLLLWAGASLPALVVMTLEWSFSARGAAVSLVLGGLAAAAGAWRFGRTTLSSLNDLARGTQYVAEGRYTHRLPVRGDDEVSGLVGSFNLMLESLQGRERIRSAMDKVVSHEIAEELLKGDLRLGGEIRFGSILFADVRGFTALSEQMNPQELVIFLNEYLTLMSRIVERNRGVVDKYIGDCVMGLFGAPVSHDQDVDNALQAALEMVWSVEEFNYRRAWEGRPSIGVSVGLNTGPVVAGNMGSEDRLNYTVVGDAVNLAYRLENLTRLYNVPCLVTEYTVREARRSFTFRELDTVRVKGRTTPVRIFELWSEEGRPEKIAEIIGKFHDARRFYLLREWDRAETLFKQVLELRPQDGPTRLYLARVGEMRLVPPAENWDGVHVALVK